METPVCTLFTELTRSNHKVLTSWRSPRYHHWSLHSRCFHHLGTKKWIGLGVNLQENPILWKNRWFPVKIFPTNPLRTVSHCGWGIPIFVGEPWNAMHTPFETGFVGVRGPFQGVTAYSGFQKRLGGWPSDSEKNIAEKTSANRWIIMMKSWKTLHKKSSAWHHSVFMPSSLPS